MSCDDSLVGDVLDFLGTLNGLAGGDYQRGGDCYQATRELFAGTTLRDPVGDGEFRGHGGRGDRLADGAICALRDLAGAPVRARATADAVIGSVSIEQELGFLSFDPTAKRMRGYQKVYVCAPILGCLDVALSELEAWVTKSSYAETAWTAADWHIQDGFGLAFTADEAIVFADFDLPTIPVATPIGPVEVTPHFGYSSAITAITSPYGADVASHQAMFGEAFQPNTGMLVELTDIYGRNGGVVQTAFFEEHGLGWNSHLGWGARGADPDASVWVYDPKDTWQTRPDWDLAVPRRSDEHQPTVDVEAGARVEYDIRSYLPNALLSVAGIEVRSARVFVDPKFIAGFTAQTDLGFREATTNLNPDTNPARAEEFMAILGVDAYSTYELEIGMDLAVYLEVDLGLTSFEQKIVDIHPRAGVPIGESKDNFARSEGRAHVYASYGPMETPVYGRFVSFNRGAVDGEAFVDACLTEPPPTEAAPPQPQATPGDPTVLMAGLLFPCNVCVAWAAQHLESEGDSYNLPAHAEKIFPPAFPTHLPEDEWPCHPGTTGCSDLCTLNPETHELLWVDKTAIDVYGAALCDPPIVK